MEDALVCLQPRELETDSCWSDLPQELLSVILSQIFLPDRCNFKLVCKSWNLTSPIPQSLPPPVESPYFNSPCLMFSNWSNNSWKLFHSLYNQFYNLDFQELKDAKIHFSKYGWLLMSRDELTLFFFNPFTNEKVELPSITCSFSSVCFTTPPTSPDCTVAGIFSSSTIRDIDFGLLKVGDKKWKSQGFENTDGYFWISTCPPLYYNGVYYCLDSHSRNIYVFDPTEEDNWRWVPYRKTSRDEEEEKDKDELHEHYMVEVEGDIWGVFVTKKERRVSVKKLDSSHMRWIELETLGNKCLYVSPNGSFAETCTVNGIANKIYFNKFHGKSGVLFSLKSGMYYSVEGDFASEGAYGLVEVDYGAWIKPTL
ncbi:hypothetical protein BUALT_Bualt17G0090300 [Buddleja alternifolia]|uniref:F-box domain-containing protein n=1 Tax=Buddleja alternifolia TaxID=168488 RepID=A0AAV6W773_9LAMI|nr:hypothetical protein BUALT_Bualt17G0090300 [Buddleja alternifolia]